MSRAAVPQVADVIAPPDTQPLLLLSAAATDPGRTGWRNEDCYCADPSLGLFAVVDGMGGHSVGRTASAAVADALEASVRAQRDPAEGWAYGTAGRGTPAAGRIQAAVLAANDRLRRCLEADGHFTGLAATLAAVLVEGRRVAVANVGTCRVYHRSGGRLRQITRDHSWAAEQLRAGLIDREAARRHPKRKVVTRALSGAQVEIDVAECGIAAGDVLLLCSDGLHAVADDDRIDACLAAPDPRVSCRRLLDLADTHGAPDNTTVVVVAFA